MKSGCASVLLQTKSSNTQTRVQIGREGNHEGSKGAGTAGAEHRRDTDQDLEAVPSCPVIDESLGDKEKEKRMERGDSVETSR